MRVRLGKLTGKAVEPWADAEPTWRAWALSEVMVRVGRVTGEDTSDPLVAAAIEATKSCWPSAERVVPLIALQEQRGIWMGAGRNPSGHSVRLRYTPVVGLSFE
jgi:hypothetical protein